MIHSNAVPAKIAAARRSRVLLIHIESDAAASMRPRSSPGRPVPTVRRVRRAIRLWSPAPWIAIAIRNHPKRQENEVVPVLRGDRLDGQNPERWEEHDRQERGGGNWQRSVTHQSAIQAATAPVLAAETGMSAQVASK
ncbi:MAG: hypothetical protein CME06_07360 [Gemmatimonadetes bacterium]|nr:hypothetical protein [Gemmatimonadota bacterium]